MIYLSDILNDLEIEELSCENKKFADYLVDKINDYLEENGHNRDPDLCEYKSSW